MRRLNQGHMVKEQSRGLKLLSVQTIFLRWRDLAYQEIRVDLRCMKIENENRWLCTTTNLASSKNCWKKKSTTLVVKHVGAKVKINTEEA